MALTTQHAYDSLGRRSATTDAKAGVVSFGYDLRDETTWVKDPRQRTTSYNVDGMANVRQLASPDTGTATSNYDAAGNLKNRTDARGVLATYSYDALNRLTQAAYSRTGETSQTQTWTYDQTGSTFGYGIGRLTTATTPGTGTQFKYDELGRVVSTTHSSPIGNPYAVKYDYDAAGRVSRLTYPSGRSVIFGWANGQPQSVVVMAGSATVPVLDQIVMSPLGAMQGWVWQLEATPRPHYRVFDTNGRLVRQSLGLLVQDITYDDADRISKFSYYSAATAQPQPSGDRTFTYDELGRLKSSAGATNWTYEYDASGNRTVLVDNGTLRTFTNSSSSNRLDSINNPSRTIAYDPAGNARADTQAGSSSNYGASFNLIGRMSSIAQTGVAGVDFAYDAMGRRVTRSAWTSSPTNPRTVTLFAYDQDHHLIGEYKPDGTAITEYVWLGDTPVAVIKPNASGSGVQVFAIHTDHLDTPRMILDAQGQVRWRWMGEPFGASPAEEQPTAGLPALQQNLRFPGQQYEAFGGRHYNHFRDYDPTTGRYVQSDPIGLGGGINTYAYVGGNPLSYIDPLGLLQWRVLGEWRDYNNSVPQSAIPGTPGVTTPTKVRGITTVEWAIAPKCTCADGGKYKLEEVSVDFKAVAFIQRNRHLGLQGNAIIAEGQHQDDIWKWARGSGKASAEQLESRLKSISFADAASCEAFVKERMAQELATGVRPAIDASRRYWDVPGRHIN
ncbi:hypothetical protein DBR42_18815 [Pelomonas sp. HMWF004]|nr:hypothetical protein DBR42_18815 [Pelomonas sp. HMWF004]